jgi:hypothetical protein
VATWREEFFEVPIRFGLVALIFFLCTPAHSETRLLQACEVLEREARLEGNNIQLPNKADFTDVGAI